MLTSSFTVNRNKKDRRDYFANICLTRDIILLFLFLAGMIPFFALYFRNVKDAVFSAFVAIAGLVFLTVTTLKNIRYGNYDFSIDGNIASMSVNRGAPRTAALPEVRSISENDTFLVLYDRNSRLYLKRTRCPPKRTPGFANCWRLPVRRRSGGAQGRAP